MIKAEILIAGQNQMCTLFPDTRVTGKLHPIYAVNTFTDSLKSNMLCITNKKYRQSCLITKLLDKDRLLYAIKSVILCTYSKAPHLRNQLKETFGLLKND